MDIIYTWWIGSHTRLSLKHFMGPHSAVISGADETVSALLVMSEWDINASNTLGLTGLAWRVVGDLEDVVNKLL